MTCQPSNIKAPISNNRSKESREQAVAAETELSSAALRHGVTPWLLINVSASYFATTHFAREKVEREREKYLISSPCYVTNYERRREEEKGKKRNAIERLLRDVTRPLSLLSLELARWRNKFGWKAWQVFRESSVPMINAMFVGGHREATAVH